MTSEKFREWIEALPTKHFTPLRAIKDKCIECCGGEGDPTKCEIKTCPLYWFLRQKLQEKNNRPPRVVSDEVRAKRLENLKKYREMRAKNDDRR